MSGITLRVICDTGGEYINDDHLATLKLRAKKGIMWAEMGPPRRAAWMTDVAWVQRVCETHTDSNAGHFTNIERGEGNELIGTFRPFKLNSDTVVEALAEGKATFGMRCLRNAEGVITRVVTFDFVYGGQPRPATVAQRLEKHLGEMQFRQELHDQLFHSDIYNLSKPKRLTHLVLHHCKYVSELFLMVTNEHYEELQAKGPQSARIERLTVDGLIICLSMANVCNKSLFEAMEDRKLSRTDAAELLLRRMGMMAKTIEDIDHMAQSNPLGEIMESAAIMASCYMNLFLRFNGDESPHNLAEMFKLVEERLLGGESKNIHFREHNKVITGRMQQYRASERLTPQ